MCDKRCHFPDGKNSPTFPGGKFSTPKYGKQTKLLCTNFTNCNSPPSSQTNRVTIPWECTKFPTRKIPATFPRPFVSPTSSPHPDHLRILLAIYISRFSRKSGNSSEIPRSTHWWPWTQDASGRHTSSSRSSRTRRGGTAGAADPTGTTD